jgi:hypothetical protein
MSTVRDRIAEALWPWINSQDAANAIADKLLSLPGIAIVDTTVGPLDEYRGQ